MSIQLKFVLPAVAGIIALGAMLYAIAATIFSQVVESQVARRHEASLAYVDREVAVASQHALELATVLASLPPVLEAYERASTGNLDDESDATVQRAREELRAKLLPYLTPLRDAAGPDELQAHYHLHNARSFLRVGPERQVLRNGQWVDVSDDLSSFRAMVLQVNQTGRPARGIELGRLGFVIRGMAPVMNPQGNQVGSVEVMISFRRVLSENLVGPGLHYGLLMNKEHRGVTTSLRDEAEFPLMSGNAHSYVVVASDRRELLDALVPTAMLDEARTRTLHRWARPYMVSLHPVHDFESHQIGVLLVATDETPWLRDEQAFLKYLALSTAAAVLAVGLALLLSSRRVWRRIAATNVRLHDLAQGRGDLNSRLDVAGNDEMADFAREFNALMDRLQQSFGTLALSLRRVLELVPMPSLAEHRGDTSASSAGDSPASTLAEATEQADVAVRRVTAAVDAWKRAERSRSLLASIVRSSDDAIFGTDLDGTILTWNRGAERAYGLTADEAVGNNLRILVPAGFDAEAEAMLDAIWAGEPQRHCESERARKDGHRFPVSIAISPMRDEHGELAGAAVIERDITERKRAEETSERQRQQLVQADKLASLGTLVAGVAHEISNPNSFIMLNAPVVRDIWSEVVPILDEHQRGRGALWVGAMPFDTCREWVPTLLTDIEKGAERIKAIITSLKDYARQDPPTMQELVDVNQVVLSATVLTGSRIKKSTERFEVQTDDALPHVRGSFQRIEQVVVNLVLNACDALPSKSHGITVQTRRAPGAAGRLQIVVRDEGAGMTPETLKRICDPFFTTKRETGGTGLGVSISDGIVREHGGTMRFESEPGRGTTVTVELPTVASGVRAA